VEAALAPYPAMTTTDSSGFAASARAEATMAAWVNLLGLLVIVGYLIVAVVNSLVVATNVRRREIALLRLVGMTRAQVLRAMRWEALMTVVCAVLLGTVVGGLPLVVQAFGFLGSLVPAGSPLIYTAIVAGAVLVGWLLARAFGVSLSPPRWVVPEKREKSASEKQKEQKPDDEKSS